MLTEKTMINVYNKSNVYYVADMVNNTCSLIGDYDELLIFLAKNFRRFQGTTDIITNFSNEYFDNINMGDDYTHIVYNYCDSCKTEEYIYPKRYLFYDGLDRIIDIRDLKEESFKIFLQLPKKRRFCFRKSRECSRRRHSGNSFKSRMPRKIQVRRLDDILENEYNEYHFKKLEDSNNPYPDWWDDTSRRIEGNWKSQYKVNRQYGIHKNTKNNKSIRRVDDIYCDIDEVDEMLFKDFYKNKDNCKSG